MSACRAGVPLATNVAVRSELRLPPAGIGRAYLWIDPPWRLTLDGRFITGSADWPVWDGVEEPEVNRPLWEAWSPAYSTHSSLRTLTEVVEANSASAEDLKVDSHPGHAIEVFGDASDDCHCWLRYYRDPQSHGEVFDSRAASGCHPRAGRASGWLKATESGKEAKRFAVPGAKFTPAS